MIDDPEDTKPEVSDRVLSSQLLVEQAFGPESKNRNFIFCNSVFLQCQTFLHVYALSVVSLAYSFLFQCSHAKHKSIT